MKTFKMILIAITFIFSVSTFAGYVQPWPVGIDFDEDGNFTAYGDMWTARSDASDQVAIGCSVKKYPAQGKDWGFCQASDENGEYVVCWTQDQKMLEAIYAINGASGILFNGNGNTGNAQGECTHISISSQSLYLPLVTTE